MIDSVHPHAGISIASHKDAISVSAPFERRSHAQGQAQSCAPMCRIRLKDAEGHPWQSLVPSVFQHNQIVLTC